MTEKFQAMTINGEADVDVLLEIDFVGRYLRATRTEPEEHPEPELTGATIDGRAVTDDEWQQIVAQAEYGDVEPDEPDHDDRERDDD